MNNGMKLTLKEVMYHYHIEDYLGGRLQHDEFLEDIQGLIATAEREALKDFVGFLINEKLVVPVARDKGEAYRIQRDLFSVIDTYLSLTDKKEVNE